MRMTPSYIARVYYRPRDDKGRLLPPRFDSETLSEFDEYCEHLFAIGIYERGKQRKLWDQRRGENGRVDDGD